MSPYRAPWIVLVRNEADGREVIVEVDAWSEDEALIRGELAQDVPRFWRAVEAVAA